MRVQKLELVGRFCCLIGIVAFIAVVGADTARAQGNTVSVEVVGCVFPGSFSSPGKEEPYREIMLVQAPPGHREQSYNITGYSPKPAWNMQVKLTGSYRAGVAPVDGGLPLSDIKWTYDFDRQSCGGHQEGDGLGPAAGLGAWAGTYQTQTKWGGATGTWRDTRQLVITEDDKVVVDGKEINGVMFSNGMMGWLAQGRNESTARAGFVPSTSKSDPYFFNPPVQGPVFQGGWLQGSAGWLDFRGRKIQ